MDNMIVIDVPENAKIKVTVGTPLGLTSILYSIEDTVDVVVPICKPLRAKPEEIFQLVTHVIGDTIKQDEVLATKKGVFGVKKVLSPKSGTLRNIDHVSGTITIEVEKTATQSHTAPVEGIVSSLDKTRGIISISVPNGQEYDTELISELAGGEASYVKLSYLATDLSVVKDKVVIIQEITPAAASKFEALDAIAIVYLTGTHSLKTAHAKVKTEKDFEQLVRAGKKKIVLLPKQKKIVAY